VGQERSRLHDHPFLPCRSGKQWPKSCQNVSNGVGKGQDYAPESESSRSASLFPRKDVMPGSFPHNGQSQAEATRKRINPADISNSKVLQCSVHQDPASQQHCFLWKRQVRTQCGFDPTQ
jgi:hypothetical protein